MEKVYVLRGCECNDRNVYVTKELAEKAAEKYNYGLKMSGSWNRVYVAEYTVVTDEKGIK
jgi:hypothetical protein